MLGLMLALALVGAPAKEIELARRTLSQESGVKDDVIHLRSWRRGRWFDADLGCAAKPGGSGGLARRGVEVVLEAGGRDYSVHVAGQRAVVCAPASAGTPPPLDPAAREPVRLARADLAAQLKIGDGQIETHRVQPMVWPDGSLGCPRRGLFYPQVVTRGYLIELQAEGRIWPYHSDLRRAIACAAPAADGRLGRQPGADQPPPAGAPVEE